MKKIRTYVLSHTLTRELFFLMTQKKVNLRKIDKKIDKLSKFNDKRNEIKDLIVSLTSYGKRLNELHYTLYSLITQSIKPEKIIVNVAHSDMGFIDSKLRSFEKFGVEFNFCNDLRSYKKLIPTMEKYPEKIIVTADDDLFYSKNWLEKLWKEHKNFSKDVICHLAYKITFNKDSILSYQKWIHNAKIKNYDNSIFLLGGAGCLYPPHSLLKDYNNIELFQKLAPYADDIWFYFMTILNKTKIRQVKYKPELKLHYVNPYREYGISEGDTLTQLNVGEGQNDKQFRAIQNNYGISDLQFIEYLNNSSEYVL